MTCELDLGVLVLNPLVDLNQVTLNRVTNQGSLVLNPLVDLGAICIPSRITDPILGLGPVWAMDSLNSIVGLEHLAEILVAADLVSGNDALQSEGIAREPVYYDKTAQGGRGAIWAKMVNVQHWLQTALPVPLGESFTIILEIAGNGDSDNFNGWFSIRPTWDGNSAIEMYSTDTGATAAKNVVRNRDGSLGVTTVASVTSGDGGGGRASVILVPGLDQTPDRGVRYYSYGESVASTSGGTAELAAYPLFLGRGYSSNTSNLSGWIMSLYAFNRWLTDEEIDQATAELDRRNPDYFRDAIPEAWSHFRFREVATDVVAVDAAGGIPAGGDLMNGTLPRHPMGAPASPMGYLFDGVNDSVDLPLGSLDFIQVTGIFTIELFTAFNDLGGTSNALCGNWTGSTSNSFLLDVVPELRFTALGSTVTGQVEVGTVPQHVVVTGDGTTVRMYVNGSEINNGPFAAADPSVTVPGIGASQSRFYNGEIGEPNFHQVALTQEEIQARGRLYRGDLGARLLAGIGEGGDGYRHLFMLEETVGAVEALDRVTGKVAPYQGGPLTGIYSPVRGTTRRLYLDGVNDGLNFPKADVEVNIMTDDWTMMVFMSRTQQNTTSVMGMLHEDPAPDGGFYLGTTGANIFGRVVGDDGTATTNAYFNDNTGQVNLYAVRHDAAAKTVQAIIIKPEQSLVIFHGTLASTVVCGNYDYPNGLNLGRDLGQPYTTVMAEMSAFGLVKRVLTDTELLWIADVARWNEEL